MPQRSPQFSPLTNRNDINDLLDRVEKLEKLVAALQADLTDPNEGEAPLEVPPFPRTLRELGIGTPPDETTDRDTGG